jgi:uncharacterized protein
MRYTPPTKKPKQAHTNPAKPKNMTPKQTPGTPKSLPPVIGSGPQVVNESLIEYPSMFPIKVMGERVDGLVHAVVQVAKSFDPQFDERTVELRESSTGKYLGVTITVTATSREQLDELYRTLSTHPMVKVVL